MPDHYSDTPRGNSGYCVEPGCRHLADHPRWVRYCYAHGRQQQRATTTALHRRYFAPAPIRLTGETTHAT